MFNWEYFRIYIHSIIIIGFVVKVEVDRNAVYILIEVIIHY